MRASPPTVSSSYAAMRKAIIERVDPDRRLDDVREVALVGGLVEVLEALARGFRVGAQVIVGPVGHALELAPSPWKQEFEISGGGRVVGELGRLVMADAQHVARHPEIEEPL